MIPALSMRGTNCDDWMRCIDFSCKTFIQTKVPLYHQSQILADNHREVGVFGGYGSGKTVAGYLGDEKHVMLTPNGETLIGAATLVQINNTVRKDLEGDFPAEFVKAYNKQQNQVQFQNGHILHYRPLQNEGDLRSYNVSRVHLLEASEIKYECYTQAQTRLRNEAAVVPFYDAEGAPIYVYDNVENRLLLSVNYDTLQMLIESNPDSGWIKSKILEQSEEVIIYDSNRVSYDPANEIHDFKRSHVIPTKANYMLAPSFYAAMRAGKPEWWVKRYLEGDFSYSEGLVYKNSTKRVVVDFPIPDYWQRIIGFDYGLNDNSHFVFGALDWFGEHFKNGKPAIFWFHEIVANNLNIKGLANEYKRTYRTVVPTGSLYRSPVMDKRSFYLRQKTNALKTLGKLFLEEGLYFDPAEMNLDARIAQVNTFLDNENMFFFKYGFKSALAEFKNYKYPDRKLEREKASDKPEDKRNHGINATEFATMLLNSNLKPNRAIINQHNNSKPLNIEQYNPFSTLHSPNENQYDERDGFGSAFKF